MEHIEAGFFLFQSRGGGSGQGTELTHSRWWCPFFWQSGRYIIGTWVPILRWVGGIFVWTKNQGGTWILISWPLNFFQPNIFMPKQVQNDPYINVKCNATRGSWKFIVEGSPNHSSYWGRFGTLGKSPGLGQKNEHWWALCERFPWIKSMGFLDNHLMINIPFCISYNLIRAVSHPPSSWCADAFHEGFFRTRYIIKNHPWNHGKETRQFKPEIVFSTSVLMTRKSVDNSHLKYTNW